jgi:hypothetical protein
MRKSVLAIGGMKVRKLVLATALATVGFAASANASLVSLDFVPYGAGITPPSVPPGEKAVTISAATLTGTFSLVTGTTGDHAAPAFSSTPTFDPNQYLALLTGDSATLSLGGEYQAVEIYIGSLDAFNTIMFSNGLIYTGGDLASMTTALDNGNQSAGTSNGLFYFVFSPGEAVTSVTFSSTGNALEVAGVSASSAVPEPATWAMLMLGFAGLGYAAFRRSAKHQSAVSPI